MMTLKNKNITSLPLIQSKHRSFFIFLILLLGSLLSPHSVFANSYTQNCPADQAVTSFDGGSGPFSIGCTTVSGVAAGSGTCSNQWAAAPDGNQPACWKCMGSYGTVDPNQFVDIDCPSGQIATGLSVETGTGCQSHGWIVYCASLPNGWTMGGSGGIQVLTGLRANDCPGCTDWYDGHYANINPPSTCGSFGCQSGENCSNCPQDCGACPVVCGQYGCQSGEDCSNCPADCGSCSVVCGQYGCQSGENCSNCPQDCGACPVVCGQYGCQSGEDCANCPADCGTCPIVCGQYGCQAGETCANCPADCGTCPVICPDGSCNFGETCATCPQDCGACTCTGTLGPFTWTDDPLTVGVTRIRMVHVNEMMGPINALRADAGLGVFDWSQYSLPVSTSTYISNKPINGLRTALREVYQQCSDMPAWNATISSPPTIADNSAIRALHIQELRTAINGAK